jgi:hypothetical protein
MVAHRYALAGLLGGAPEPSKSALARVGSCCVDVALYSLAHDLCRTGRNVRRSWLSNSVWRNFGHAHLPEA